MRIRSRSVAVAAAIATTMAASVLVHGQVASSAKTPAGSPAAPEKKAYMAPHLPSGQPDIQGIWTNLSFTPMVRPAKYGMREFLTKEEMETEFKTGVARSYETTLGNTADSPFYDATTYALDAWQNGVQPNPRTSLIVDPPNGQMPAFTPEVAKARAARPAGGGNAVAKMDTIADIGGGVRCHTFGGPPMLPSVSNSNVQIVQGADSVLLEWEWDSTPRIVPINGGPHLSPRIRRWNGDSRGHWEGATLVVETTNFRPGATYMNANADTLKITERFTRISDATVEYKFTIDDPTTWTKPWSAIVPLSKIKGPMPEFSCSEGNFALVEMLAAARAAEKSGSDKAPRAPAPRR